MHCGVSNVCNILLVGLLFELCLRNWTYWNIKSDWHGALRRRYLRFSFWGGGIIGEGEGNNRVQMLSIKGQLSLKFSDCRKQTCLLIFWIHGHNFRNQLSSDLEVEPPSPQKFLNCISGWTREISNVLFVSVLKTDSLIRGFELTNWQCWSMKVFFFFWGGGRTKVFIPQISTLDGDN